ncbi:MAG: hypothetical protein Faunusvirus8_9 [Faunusvirus sp.]|jgi:hypothetical protein|uniref:Uncharacterized protein n=1 Tax=Faunusvirus sp. TaxID=2487766 RepID=A0A3G4ZWJ9_9VIRU|nr:MAG: hypothetical protein Faunusvirus8_9 [Faunusvirus sp.]
MSNKLEHPLVFGFVAGIIAYMFIRLDKKADENKRFSLKYPVLVGLMVWFAAYYFQNMVQVPTVNIMAPLSQVAGAMAAEDIFMDDI